VKRDGSFCQYNIKKDDDMIVLFVGVGVGEGVGLLLCLYLLYTTKTMQYLYYIISVVCTFILYVVL